MKEKFEKKETVKDDDGKEEDKFTECDKAEAQFKHICYHDEDNPKPCKRVPL